MKVIKLNFEVLFSKRLLVRAASSIVMAIPALTFVFLGGLYFIAFLAFLAGVMSWELNDTIHKSKKYTYKIGTAIIVFLITLIFGIFLEPAFSALHLPFFVVLLVILTFLIRKFSVVARSLLGNLLVLLSCISIVWLRFNVELEYFFWILASVVATDIGAFIFGALIGGVKLAPKISPNKTWAGLLGGIITSIIIAWIFNTLWLKTEFYSLLLMGATLAIVSQAGDLIESAYKRSYNLKDSSNLIPGHGGFLDRLDGHMAAGTFMSFIVLYSGGAVV